MDKVGNSEKQMIKSRIEKINDLREKGIDPYPASFAGRDFIKNIYYNVDYTPSNKKIAGRIVGKRNTKSMLFLDVEDSTGKIEIHVNNINLYNNKIIFENISLGDLVGIEGVVGKNRREDSILELNNIIILAKAIRNPPDKVNGINDDEFRFRHREVEMLSEKETRDLFVMRSKVIAEIRHFLENEGFIEVETPVLQPIYGGATARPFTTHHNSLNRDFYLRISSELYLKRYLVGGLDKVFHIGKCFRNEGISTEHSPEFTMVEFFQTCIDEKEIRRLTIDIIGSLLDKFGKKKNGLFYGIKFDDNLNSDDWPLSRKSPEDSSRANAWELYIGNMEIASGASDLNDPVEQAERWINNTASKVEDDNDPESRYEPFKEANPYDEAYIKSLEYGSLPFAGVGIGIDRLMMILTGKKNIREITAFPAMK